MNGFHLALRAAAAAGVLFLAVQPASAAKMLATFEGSVVSGADGTNVFGLGDGASLAGWAFTARYVYDTDLGLATITASNDERIGGPGNAPYTYTSPILLADFTLNGVTETLDIAQNGSVNVFTNLADGWLQTFAYTDFFVDNGPGNGAKNSMTLFVLDAPLPLPLRLTDSYVGFNNDFPGPPIETNEIFKSVWLNGAHVTDYSAVLETSKVTLEPWLDPTAVPEPAAWSLMITGFGALGLMLRRRRAHRPA